MAATSGQSRWRDGQKEQTLRSRITRSAKVLGRSAFGADPGRVGGEDLRSAVSPHWKRVSTAGTRAGSGAATVPDVKVQRRALLVSDFRFVSRSLAERNRQLEGEFERFANSFGGEGKGSFVEFADPVGESIESRKKRRKNVRFAGEEEEEEEEEEEAPAQKSWDIGFWEEMQSDFRRMHSGAWDAPLPVRRRSDYYQQPTTMPTMNGSGFPNLYPTSSGSGPSTRAGHDGDNNSLYTNAAQLETVEIDPQTTHLREEEASVQTMQSGSASFIEELAIPDLETKAQAIARLKTVERHLSLSQDSLAVSGRESISLPDRRLLPAPLSAFPHLLSASLDTALADSESGASFFYCPYLACHRRLVHQNARVPPTQKERSCVHTDCSFVSHDVEGWIKHCNTLHHGHAREGHEACGFGCYSNEDTH